MINKKNKGKVLGLLISVILIVDFCYFVSAFGFSNDYPQGHPFIVAPGETKEMIIYLVSTSTEQAILNLTSGGEIATITDSSNIYNISNAAGVHIRVSVPADVPEGTGYKVSLSAKSITTSSGGMITFGFQTGATAYVLVKKPTAPVENPASSFNATWIILALIIAVAIIVIIYLIIKNRPITIK